MLVSPPPISWSPMIGDTRQYIQTQGELDVVGDIGFYAKMDLAKFGVLL